LVCVEPLAPVEYITLNKLVSPIICVDQFNHQNQLAKGLTLFPFQGARVADFDTDINVSDYLVGKFFLTDIMV
jgi:hypothetical protein